MMKFGRKEHTALACDVPLVSLREPLKFITSHATLICSASRIQGLRQVTIYLSMLVAFGHHTIIRPYAIDKIEAEQ